MLELCKGERGEKVVTKASHRRKRERYSWNFSKERKERKERKEIKEIKVLLELFRREK
jgi:hypothetical protein